MEETRELIAAIHCYNIEEHNILFEIHIVNPFRAHKNYNFSLKNAIQAFYKFFFIKFSN